MAWGKSIPGGGGMGAGPFAANYNRAYDTHTAKTSNTAFANNDISYADAGPDEYSGVGGDPISRQYRNPLTFAPDAANGDLGYLGHAVGPRELQTGNAASGGYSTFPLSFSAGFQQGAIPDNRRMAERTRPDDWEARQGPIHARRDANLVSRRAANVRESWVQFDTLPAPVHAINAVEDSPYRKDWSDAHAANGQGGSATYRTNPNRFRNFDRYDYTGEYANSGARYLNGSHYSMAVHQTMTPYGPSTDGANPVRALRNTYRIAPAPWDTTNTDGPANTPSYVTTTNLGDGGNAGLPSYRLM